MKFKLTILILLSIVLFGGNARAAGTARGLVEVPLTSGADLAKRLENDPVFADRILKAFRRAGRTEMFESLEELVRFVKGLGPCTISGFHHVTNLLQNGEVGLNDREVHFEPGFCLSNGDGEGVFIKHCSNVVKNPFLQTREVIVAQRRERPPIQWMNGNTYVNMGRGHEDMPDESSGGQAHRTFRSGFNAVAGGVAQYFSAGLLGRGGDDIRVNTSSTGGQATGTGGAGGRASSSTGPISNSNRNSAEASAEADAWATANNGGVRVENTPPVQPPVTPAPVPPRGGPAQPQTVPFPHGNGNDDGGPADPNQ